jgi:hypothetical protein
MRLTPGEQGRVAVGVILLLILGSYLILRKKLRMYLQITTIETAHKLSYFINLARSCFQLERKAQNTGRQPLSDLKLPSKAVFCLHFKI